MKSRDITPASNHTDVTIFKGFSVKEDAAAPAEIEFRDKTVTGQVLANLNLTAGQSATFVNPEYLESDEGVYVKEVSGSITGVLYY